MEENVTVKLTELEQRIRSNTRRIECLEHGQEALNRLTTAVGVLATKQDGMGEDLKSIGQKIDLLESRPLRRWETIFDRVIVSVLSLAVGCLLAKMGLSA